MAWLKVSLPSLAGTATAGVPAFRALVLLGGVFAALVVRPAFAGLATLAGFADLPAGRFTPVLPPDFFAVALLALAFFFISPRRAMFALDGASMFSGCAIVKPHQHAPHFTGQAQYFSIHSASSRTLIFPCQGFWSNSCPSSGKISSELGTPRVCSACSSR